MKRFVAAFLSLVLAVGVAGCSAPGNASGSSAPAASGSSGSAATEEGSLVVWAWDQNILSVNSAYDKFKEKNPDTKVSIKVLNVPDTVSKLSTFFASGSGTDLPDVVLMDNLQIQSFLQQFPDKFVNLSKMGYDKHKTEFSNAQWQLLSHEGSVYAFPFDIAPIMVQVNTKIFDQVGVKPDTLKTWDDVIAATPAVNKAGYAMNVKFDEREVFALMQSAGVGIFDSKQNIDLLNPKVVEVIDLYQKLQKSNASDKTADSATFGQGKAAMYMKPAWAVGEDMPVQKDLDGVSKLIPLPKVKNAAGYTSSANDGGSSFFILGTSKLQNTAYKVCETLTTDLDVQQIGVNSGLMPGYLPTEKLSSFTAKVSYYQNQSIWKDLSNSAKDTAPLYVNQYYSTAKDVVKNTIIDAVASGTDKSAKDLLKEAADSIAAQTGLKVNPY